MNKIYRWEGISTYWYESNSMLAQIQLRRFGIPFNAHWMSMLQCMKFSELILLNIQMYGVRLINISSICFSLEIVHRVEHYKCIIHISVEFSCIDFVTIFKILIRFFFSSSTIQWKRCMLKCSYIWMFHQKMHALCLASIKNFVAIVEKKPVGWQQITWILSFVRF